MKARLTAWLSLLLVFSAAFGAPVTTAYTNNRVTCCYVYSEQRKHRAEQIAEAVERPSPPAPEIATSAPSEPEAGTILGFSLFQRPPPALS